MQTAIWTVSTVILQSSLLALTLAGPTQAEEMKQLNVSVISFVGFSMQDDKGNWVGLVPDIVNELGKRLKFEPNYKLVGDARFGAYDVNSKNWTGLIGEVVSGRVHFAAAPLTLTSLRETHVDFTHEFLDTGLSFVIRKPEWTNPVSRSATFFLSVYDAGVWASVILIFVLTSFLIFLNDRYNPREFKTREAEHNSRSAAVSHNLLIQMNDFSLFGSLFYVISTGCFQGYRRAPQSLVGRSLSVFWWIFACLFSAAYVAGLLCALVASRGNLERQLPLRGLAEPSPSDSTSFKGFSPVWLINGSTDAFFKKHTEGAFQMINRQHKDAIKSDPAVGRVASLDDLFNLIRSDGRYFGVIETVMADYRTRVSDCEFLSVGNLIYDRGYAFAFPHGSNWTRKVNLEIVNLRETGFIRRSYRKHFLHDSVTCNNQPPSESTVTMSLAGEEMAKMFRNSLPITLRSFSGPLIFYFISILISAAAGLADIYVYTRFERYRQGNQPFQSAPEQAEPEPEPEQPEEPSFGALTFSDEQRLSSRDRAS